MKKIVPSAAAEDTGSAVKPDKPLKQAEDNMTVQKLKLAASSYILSYFNSLSLTFPESLFIICFMFYH